MWCIENIISRWKGGLDIRYAFILVCALLVMICCVIELSFVVFVIVDSFCFRWSPCCCGSTVSYPLYYHRWSSLLWSILSSFNYVSIYLLCYCWFLRCYNDFPFQVFLLLLGSYLTISNDNVDCNPGVALCSLLVILCTSLDGKISGPPWAYLCDLIQ